MVPVVASKKISHVTADTMDTCTLMIKLVRSTTVHFDKLSEYACTGTLQQVSCQAAKKQYKLGIKIFCL